MKKFGCFFTTLISITIIIGIVFYIIKKYGPELWEHGKERLVEIAVSDLESRIESIEPSVYKDSLETLVGNYINDLQTMEFEEIKNESSYFLERVSLMITDDTIDSLEIIKLTEIYKEYERSKKD